MNEREDTGGAIVALAITALLCIPLWWGIWAVLVWVYRLPAEVWAKGGAGTFLVLGSWLVLRACRELDQ